MYSINYLLNKNNYDRIKPNYKFNALFDKKYNSRNVYIIIVLASVIVICLLLIYFYSKYQKNPIDVKNSTYEKLVKQTTNIIITPACKKSTNISSNQKC